MAEKLSFGDTKKRVVTVYVVSETTDMKREVDIELPSMSEWNGDLLTIQFPVPPTLQRMKEGKKEDYQNFNDPEYILMRDRAFERLNMRRTVRALRNAGNLEDMSELSLDELTDKCIEESDKSFFQCIHRGLADIMNGTKGGAEAKKAAFPANPIPENGHADMRETELVK
jgi:hypothetical protein